LRLRDLDDIKVAILFPINKFPQKNIWRKINEHAYYMYTINASCEGICVKFERKNKIH